MQTSQMGHILSGWAHCRRMADQSIEIWTEQPLGKLDTSTASESSWIESWCLKPANHSLCVVEKGYIEDSFNLYGLKQIIGSEYAASIDVILDNTPEASVPTSVARSAELLYGLIHARYILSGSGLMAMNRKYENKEFGVCPRLNCKAQAVLPLGLSECAGQYPLKLYCPKCSEVYSPPATSEVTDGAFFGCSFPGMFMLTFDCQPTAVPRKFIPQIFGFKLHSPAFKELNNSTECAGRSHESQPEEHPSKKQKKS